MDADFFAWLPVQDIGPMLSMFDSELVVAGIVFVATATLIAFCVPGVLIPIALSSGALLGAWGAVAAVALGALAGSQMFFLAARYLAGDRLRGKLGKRLQAFERRFAAHGVWYVVGLRLIGAPHLLVAGGSALMPIRSSSFAAATLVGFLPAIALAAAAGSAI